ncbi:MAG: FecR domain-containing protein [Saprospiraceae bacterium]|nr:FecR domain-containing protein [Saprospiraceae bacterium]
MNDHYKKYSTEDLITDEAFIEWVLQGDAHKEHIWESWMTKNPEMKTRIDKARDLILNISIKKLDTKASADQIWTRIQNDLQVQPTKASGYGKLIRIIAPIAVAASFLLLIITQFGGSDFKTIKATSGMATSHQLPDESIVTINDGSTIKYNDKDFQNSRVIQLEGEAFFEVTKGSTFTVRTLNGEVEVLGTSFNIFSHHDQLNVICKTGKVKVANSTSEVILIAGETAYENKAGKLIHQRSNSDQRIKWMDGIFEYQEAKLTQVAEELERQFNIEIQMPAELENTLYTGFFIDDDLDKALSSVFWPLKLNIEKRHQQVIISQ